MLWWTGQKKGNTEAYKGIPPTNVRWGKSEIHPPLQSKAKKNQQLIFHYKGGGDAYKRMIYMWFGWIIHWLAAPTNVIYCQDVNPELTGGRRGGVKHYRLLHIQWCPRWTKHIKSKYTSKSSRKLSAISPAATNKRGRKKKVGPENSLAKIKTYQLQRQQKKQKSHPQSLCVTPPEEWQAAQQNTSRHWGVKSMFIIHTLINPTVSITVDCKLNMHSGDQGFRHLAPR